MKPLLALAALVIAMATPAVGEVRSVGEGRFEIEHQVDVAIDPNRLYRLLGKPALWWSDAHTFSGKAANLSIELKPLGCWCEKMPDGSRREHMMVGIAEPGRRLLLLGLLGPLQQEAKAGTMIWTVKPGPTGSRLVLNYKVAGMATGKSARFAPAVDRVLGEQLAGLQKAALGRVGIRHAPG